MTEDDCIAVMRERNKRFNTEESGILGRGFAPRPTDVFVTTYPKCGTTWVTQICHSLRSGGDMDFKEITEVCPWDVMALDCGEDLDAQHVANPRVWKSHEPFWAIAKNRDHPAKYIHVARNPLDAFISFYHFLPNYMVIPEGKITMEGFANSVFAGVSNSGQIWDYFMSWLNADATVCRVMWVFYEDLKEDLETEIKRIAEFMEIELDNDLLDTVKHHSSFEFMRDHANQFDDHFVFDAIKDRLGIPPLEIATQHRVGKVRSNGGKIGDRNVLPPLVRDLLEKKWNDVILAQTGCATYDEFKKYQKQK